jgi:hypothetical protein
MINNLLNKLFGIEPLRGTGAFANPFDYRDITLASLGGPTSAPDSFKESEMYLKALEVLDQMQVGACVPHAIAELLMLYIFKVTGKIVQLSPRFVYKLCKMLDGIPDMSGTFPRVGALVFVKIGCAVIELIKNDTSLSEKLYIDFEITDEMLDSAHQHKMPGFAVVYAEIESIKLAISQNGAVTGSTQCGDWTALPVRPMPSRGFHYTLWYGYEKLSNGDYKIFFKNSWGKGWLAKLKKWLFGGYGYFLWSEYKDYVRDIIVFTEIPKTFLDIIKIMPYRFSKELKLGDTHPDVKELQKMLNASPDTMIVLEGAGSPGEETSYFGMKTRDALIKWQVKKGISPQSGYFGPISIRKANERIGTSGSKIRLWALAIQSHEGYYAGSRSFRNKNPGNIRYSGLFTSLAIGKDSSGFCVFETYEKGLDALEILLTRACSGLSSVYSPNDTLLSFYEKYAPSSDGNHPLSYATAVANKIGVPIGTKIKELL